MNKLDEILENNNVGISHRESDEITQVEYLLGDIEEVSLSRNRDERSRVGELLSLINIRKILDYSRGIYNSEVHELMLNFAHLSISYKGIDKKLCEATRNFNKGAGNELYNSWVSKHQKLVYR